jgi:hypothetical protein
VNGDRYEGEWKHHLRHGQGSYFYMETGLAFERNEKKIEEKKILKMNLFYKEVNMLEYG